jgi:hypothetical protein
MKYSILVLIFVSIASLFSCKNEVASINVVRDRSFQPMEIGKFWEYRLDTIFYNDATYKKDTTICEIKEVVADTFYDNSGYTNYRIERFKRKNASQPWAIHNVWYGRYFQDKFERIEDNQRVIKMVLPLTNYQTWNGSAYIFRDTVYTVRNISIEIYKDWGNFQVTDLNNAFTDAFTSILYPKTLEITQVKSENNIELRYSIERYAQDIGLVFKQMKILDTQCRGNLANCVGKTWEEKAEKGFIINWHLLRHN